MQDRRERIAVAFGLNRRPLLARHRRGVRVGGPAGRAEPAVRISHLAKVGLDHAAPRAAESRRFGKR